MGLVVVVLFVALPVIGLAWLVIRLANFAAGRTVLSGPAIVRTASLTLAVAILSVVGWFVTLIQGTGDGAHFSWSFEIGLLATLAVLDGVCVVRALKSLREPQILAAVLVAAVGIAGWVLALGQAIYHPV